MFFIVLICLINLAISFVNARSCGQVWCESKVIGGWFRVLVWCGAVQSAIGFTSVYMVFAVAILTAIGKLSPQDTQYLMSFYYVMIIVPAIGTGFIIMLHSWMSFAREKNLRNFSVAAWNTFAESLNVYRAYHAFGPAMKTVGELFSGGSKRDNKKNVNIIMLAIFVFMLGIATTAVIIMRYAGTLEIPESIRNKFETKEEEQKERLMNKSKMRWADL